MKNFHSHKICIKPSPGKGRGVFANVDIAQGSSIECSPVIFISEKQWKLVEKTSLENYVFESEEGGVFLALGSVSLYNHSFDENALFDPHNDYIEITAKRDIKSGEEVHLNYNWEIIHYLENKMISAEEALGLDNDD